MSNEQEEQTNNSYSLTDVLKGKTAQYADAYTNSQLLLEKKNEYLRCEKARHILTLGRLLKYEGKDILDEMFDYAVNSGMFLKCNSSVINLKTKVGIYVPKHKVKNEQYAHYTLYHNYYKSAKSKDEEPIFYSGNFLIKEFKEVLHKKFLLFREKWTPEMQIKDISDIFGLTPEEKNEKVI